MSLDTKHCFLLRHSVLLIIYMCFTLPLAHIKTERFFARKASIRDLTTNDSALTQSVCKSSQSGCFRKMFLAVMTGWL